MAGTEPVDDSFLDEVDDSFLDEVDEVDEVNAPEKSKPRLDAIRDALGSAAQWLTETEADALLGALQGGTLESAPLISRMLSNLTDPDARGARLAGNRRAANQPYREAAERSPWAHGAGRLLGGLPAAMVLTKGKLAAGTAKGGALGAVQGFLGSESGANADTLGEEFSGDNLMGKFGDAAKAGGLATVLGGAAGLGVNKLMKLLAPKAVVGSAPAASMRGASQLDDVAPPLDDVMAGPPVPGRPDFWPGQAKPGGTKPLPADDVADEIFAKGDPNAGTKKLGVKKPDPNTDTAAGKEVLDDFGKGGDGPGYGGPKNKAPQFIDDSGELAKMLGQDPSVPVAEPPLPYGNKYAKGPLSFEEQFMQDEIASNPNGVAKRLMDELRGPQPKQPIDIGDDFAAQLDSEMSGPQRMRSPPQPKQPIDAPGFDDMLGAEIQGPQRVRPSMRANEPIDANSAPSDALFADISESVNAQGGQNMRAPQMRPTDVNPLASSESSEQGLEQLFAPQLPRDPSAPARFDKARGTMSKVGKRVGQGIGGAVAGWAGSPLGPLGQLGAGLFGSEVGKDVGEKLGGKLFSPERAAQQMIKDPKQLQALAAGGGPMSGPAKFILQGFQEAGEAGMRARAFVAAAMPSMRELFAPAQDRR